MELKDFIKNAKLNTQGCKMDSLNFDLQKNMAT